MANEVASDAPPFLCIGIDVGGTKIAAGIVTFPDAVVHARRRVPTLASRGPNVVLADVLTLARELGDEARTRGEEIHGIGLGICELVNSAGEIRSGACIDWRNMPVVQGLRALAPAAFVEADVRAAALAEAVAGAGRGLESFLYVTVGTGISCSLVIDGEPYLGASGATGTMASSPLSLTCSDCGAAHSHTLEEIASGPGLVAGYNAAVGASKMQRAEDVLAAWQSGDAVAADVATSAVDSLGCIVGLMVNVLDPQAVIIGGGLGLAGGEYWQRLVASTRRHIWAEFRREIPMRPATTGPDAGIIGAAGRVWREHFPTTIA